MTRRVSDCNIVSENWREVNKNDDLPSVKTYQGFTECYSENEVVKCAWILSRVLIYLLALDDWLLRTRIDKRRPALWGWPPRCRSCFPIKRPCREWQIRVEHRYVTVPNAIIRFQCFLTLIDTVKTSLLHINVSGEKTFPIFFFSRFSFARFEKKNPFAARTLLHFNFIRINRYIYPPPPRFVSYSRWSNWSLRVCRISAGEKKGKKRMTVCVETGRRELRRKNKVIWGCRWIT